MASSDAGIEPEHRSRLTPHRVIGKQEDPLPGFGGWGAVTRGALSWVLLACLGVGCAGGPTAKDVDQSRRELRLADALRDEGNTPGAIRHLQKALKLNPKNARAHLLLGYIHMQRQDFETAVTRLRRGIDLMTERSEPGGAVAEARNVLGLALIHSDRIDKAVPVLRASAKDMLNRAPHLAWGNLGLAFYRKKEYKKAMGALQRAVDAQPHFCVGYYRMAKVHFDQKRFGKAEKASGRAIDAHESCKRYQAAWRLRGEARARLGDHEDGVADFERCVELGPDTAHGQACKRLLGGTE